MKVRRTGAGMILVSGNGSGGTTTISTGNALRQDHGLQALGIDLDEEFAELFAEIPVFAGHQKKWRPFTRKVFDICREMKLEPRVMPKMGEHAHCRNCGRCVLGCPHGIKWDSRRLLDQAQQNGARLLTSHRVEKIVHGQGRVQGSNRLAWIEKKVVPGRPDRAGRRRPGHAAYPGEFRHRLRGQALCGSGPLRGRGNEGQLPGSRNAHALCGPEKGLYHFTLLRPFELLLQSRVAPESRRYLQPDDQVG